MSESCCTGDVCHPHDSHAHEHEALSPSETRRQAATVAGAGALIAIGALAGMAGHLTWSRAADALAIALSAPGPLRRAFRAVRERELDINLLMLVASAGAAALGDWLEAAVVVWLFGVAQWLEGASMRRAERAIRSLMTLAPTEASVVRDGREERRLVSDIAPGDLVVVRPGERIPVDGFVVLGESAVDQSPVTGESWPAEKAPGDEVFAGTVNATGALEIEVSRPATESLLSRVARFVEEAQDRRAPVQRAVDRFARRYTPMVVAAALAVAFVPPFFTAGAGGWTPAFLHWSYRALALLVVACPCALVISTPVSIVSALTAAARAGVLVKGGEHLDRLAGVKCVAFDKTGTLTSGRVSVADVLAVDGASTRGVLEVAAALESRSEHPIGRAIVVRARQDGVTVPPGGGFRALPGLGAEATVADAPAIVGSHRLFEERQLCTPSLHARIEEVEGRGGTPVLVGHDGAALGVISFTDQMRAGARQAVAALRHEGVDRVVLLTGDGTANAMAVCEQLGLDEAHANLLPANKGQQVERLRARYGPVAMVGEGINDAPALALADVGIAMGVAGTDLALDTADVALMTDDLTKLPYALRLARATRRNIRGNVAIALGLKLIFVALAASGLATLWMAVLADTGASLLVTGHSLRLLRVR